MNKLNTGVMLDLNHVAMVCNVEKQMRQEESAWIKMLISKGIRAAHPDDGHINNKENYIAFGYPQFKHTVNVGDLIVFGWCNDKCRVVEVIKRGGYCFAVYDNEMYYFKETNIDLDNLVAGCNNDDFLNDKISYWDKTK